jgi:Secretion system C-terminal sorting domain
LYGRSGIFPAIPTHGGTSPSYEWLLNGQSVGNATNLFTTNELNNGDLVVCYLNSSETCLVENPVLSNAVQVSVDVCGAAGETKSNMLGFSAYPNPSNGKIIIEVFEQEVIFAVRIVNTQGQLALESLENHTNFPFKRELDLSGLPKGVYLLQIMSGTQLGVQKLVLH